ncbi:twin-arginine translocation pathway signal [Burkholderia sp. Nafp2/4-1b]|uniref:sugar dehydrogenase complex small subunit n=1 Tax=Burkholderia sp. Nafp2/4-1b TaxID=2116686 RepID=UPI000EF8FBB7|nr:sugar dehydrogenase complex small subunit [Burkholderia sp. Nafp2/4-1b]RKU05066.1 twin-arginine translocation pathway signal [Burkholderia sp. Nafp2/4-1b]
MHNDNTPHSRRDSDAAATGITRRQWLQGALALTAASLTGSLALRALADNPGTAPLDAFMTLSEALTGKKGLSRVLGERYLQALQKGAFKTADAVSQLAGALASGSLTPDQEAAALSTLGAWYLGIVDNVVIAYEEALMFSVVSDTLIIPSYCPNKPGFWAEKPTERQA